MEDWVLRGLARWPNVPHLYGWLQLDRRGHWRIQGEPITRPQIIRAIAANYTSDAHGCWYFQNGPQRGYVHLAAAPHVLHWANSAWHTQGGTTIGTPIAAVMDEEGSLYLHTEMGLGLIRDDDLATALEQLSCASFDSECDVAIAEGIASPSGSTTALRWTIPSLAQPLSLSRVDFVALPDQFGFVREPAAESL